MWSIEHIADDLKVLGVPAGASVLVHASMRSIGEVACGAQGLIEALQSVVGPQGAIMTPTFTLQFIDPADWTNPPESDGAIERARARTEVFDKDSTPSELPRMGILSEILRQQEGSVRSNHPALSFVAIGEPAQALMQDSPFHYPLGTDSPLARLHNIDGWVLLLGVGHEVNSSIHLAEVWANVPHIHRSTRVKSGPGQGTGTWTSMQGNPGCSDGFIKIEPVLRQGRLIRRGYVGNAPCQLMRQRELVSMSIAILQGSGEALLCDRPSCGACHVARQWQAVG